MPDTPVDPVGINGIRHNLTTTEEMLEKIGNYLFAYYVPALVLLGSIGNVLSVLVFFKTKLRKLSSSYYLAALGLSDTVFLVGLFVTWLDIFQVPVYTREPYCQLLTYMSGVASFLSVWYVVAFTFERFIVVRYPLKRQSWCTVRRAKTIIACLTLAGSVHSVPYFFYAGPQYAENDNHTICDMRRDYKEQLEIFNYVDTVIVFIVPFTVIVVLNSVTSLTVWRFAGLRRNMTLPKRKPSNLEIRRQMSFQYFSTHPNGRNGVLRRPSMRENRMLYSQMKVTKMLLLVSSVFVCLNLPSYVMRWTRRIERRDPAQPSTKVSTYVAGDVRPQAVADEVHLVVVDAMALHERRQDAPDAIPNGQYQLPRGRVQQGGRIGPVGHQDGVVSL
uniref:G-protein coupled receptors family 1 profile domain-containing protein n=1 Tax=Anopheles atroparvus TaxID=41427 RepID=A0A182JCT0_ANOAO